MGPSPIILPYSNRGMGPTCTTVTGQSIGSGGADNGGSNDPHRTGKVSPSMTDAMELRHLNGSYFKIGVGFIVD